MPARAIAPLTSSTRPAISCGSTAHRSLTCGVATIVLTPSSAATRAIATLSSSVFAPSSMPGRMWQCRSTTAQVCAACPTAPLLHDPEQHLPGALPRPDHQRVAVRRHVQLQLQRVEAGAALAGDLL